MERLDQRQQVVRIRLAECEKRLEATRALIDYYDTGE